MNTDIMPLILINLLKIKQKIEGNNAKFDNFSMYPKDRPV